ncbi:MAG: hypothetical protein MUF72_00160 [Elainella sp. Prado103]|nr:hypothetical protein [Elainella sp. Prado103]
MSRSSHAWVSFLDWLLQQVDGARKYSSISDRENFAKAGINRHAPCPSPNTDGYMLLDILLRELLRKWFIGQRAAIEAGW